jgi:hypothetical protein
MARLIKDYQDMRNNFGSLMEELKHTSTGQ